MATTLPGAIVSAARRVTSSGAGEPPRRVLIGVVGAPQGVRGEVRVKAFTRKPTAIGQYGPLATQDGRRTLVVSGVRHAKDDMVVARFEGVADRTAAAALTGTRLFVDRARLPPPADDDEVYHIDLIGIRAEDKAARVLGHVVSVENYGAGDILEIAPPDGGESLLVPFTKAFVPVLDVEAGRLVVAEGALGAPDDEAASAGAGGA